MIISNEEDAAYVINQILNIEEKIKLEELEKYNSSYITSRLENREADVVYKLKNKNIFFLIEQQTKVDYSMPFRLQEYVLEIQKSAIDVKKMKTKEYEMPVVIPIVIYTGKDKWKVTLNINEIKDKRFRKVNLSKYNLIDINKYRKEDLLESKYLIDKIFLLERAEGGEELLEMLKEVIRRTKDEKEQKILLTIMQTSLKQKLGKENVERIIKEMKGSEEMVLGSISRIIDKERAIGLREGIQEGIQEGIMKIINNMLRKGMKIEEIKEITGLTNKEIEEARKGIAK